MPKTKIAKTRKTGLPYTTASIVDTPRHLGAKYKQKEAWLNAALDRFVRKYFKNAGYDVPEQVRLSTGWPSRGAFGKHRVIGQAWSNKASADNTHEIIISIYLDDPVKVLGVLIHEVIHVTIGNDKGHGKAFVDCMKKVGLCGKPTATDESDELKATLAKWVDKLGLYPHAKLDGMNQKKQSTRLIKLECGECGCKIRTTQKWLDEHGVEWDCPCGGKLVAE